MSYQSEYSGAQVDEAVGKALNPDAAPTEGSANLVESGGVASAVSAVMNSVSRRNLIDNPFFTVNQRGIADATTITGNNYFADRWQATGNGVQRVAGGGINILGTAYHKLDNPGIAGKTVTLSILYSDGEISSNTFAWTGTSFSKTFKYGTVNIYPSANQINIEAQSVNVKAVKLELGSVSTLANDSPPCYAEELLKCQRYFYRYNGLTTATALANTTVTACTIPCPVTMRGVPAISSVTYYDSKVADGYGAYVSGVRFYKSNSVSFSVTGFDASADI